jgi:hypothetical protein
MVLPHQRQFRFDLLLPSGDGDNPLHELPDALVPRGDHRDDRDAEGRLQCVGVDPDALFFSHVNHVYRNDDRRTEEEELG